MLIMLAAYAVYIQIKICKKIISLALDHPENPENLKSRGRIYVEGRVRGGAESHGFALCCFAEF